MGGWVGTEAGVRVKKMKERKKGRNGEYKNHFSPISPAFLTCFGSKTNLA